MAWTLPQRHRRFGADGVNASLFGNGDANDDFVVPLVKQTSWRWHLGPGDTILLDVVPLRLGLELRTRSRSVPLI